jgi:Flp pilus assembly protein TadG
MGAAVTDRGESNVLGLVLIAPAALVVALLVLWVGRVTDTEAQVQAASAAAAQAAARQRSPMAAEVSARATAAAMLTDSAACGGGAQVSVDSSRWRPGGQVVVTVSCVPDRTDLAALAPDARELTGTASATIDPYRATALP